MAKTKQLSQIGKNQVFIVFYKFTGKLVRVFYRYNGKNSVKAYKVRSYLQNLFYGEMVQSYINNTYENYQLI